MKKRLSILAFALVIGAVGILLFDAAPALAQTGAKNQVCQGVSAVGGGSGCGGGGTSVEAIIKTAVEILSWVVGVVSIIMVIVSGFKYVASGGDSGKISSAKNTLIYALIGLAVAALAQVLVGFVLSKVA